MKNTMILGIGLLAASLVVACGSSTPTAKPTGTPTVAPSGTPSARVVDLEIGDGVITPATVTVTRGETVLFRAKNVNTVEVEIIIGLTTDVDADSGDSLKEAENIAVGQTKEVTYTFDGDGPYAYGDQIEDHYAKGAKGTITVTP